MQFNQVSHKDMLVYPSISVHDGAVCLVASSLRYMCTGSPRSCSLSVAATVPVFGITLGRALCGLCFFFKLLFSVLVLFLFFCFPPTSPPFFFLFPLLSQCNGCPCVEAHGWVAGITSPGHPGHPPSTQLDAVVNNKGFHTNKSRELLENLLKQLFLSDLPDMSWYNYITNEAVLKENC